MHARGVRALRIAAAAAALLRPPVARILPPGNRRSAHRAAVVTIEIDQARPSTPSEPVEPGDRLRGGCRARPDPHQPARGHAGPVVATACSRTGGSRVARRLSRSGARLRLYRYDPPGCATSGCGAAAVPEGARVGPTSACRNDAASSCRSSPERWHGSTAKRRLRRRQVQRLQYLLHPGGLRTSEARRARRSSTSVPGGRPERRRQHGARRASTCARRCSGRSAVARGQPSRAEPCR